MGARAAIAALAAGDTLRTWSLIVTIFGDLARAPGAEIRGPVLSALAQEIGVRPEAMRVALHRLRKDGWIASRRAGRVSHYFLTETGRVQSEEATARIFARTAPTAETWHIAIAGPLEPPGRLGLETAMVATGYLPLVPGAWLAPGPVPRDLAPGLFALGGRDLRLPDWLRASLMPPSLAAAYAHFGVTLAEVSHLLSERLDTLSPLERCAVRILLVHRWRRLVLRHPDLPDDVFPDDWTGAGTRTRVHTLLDRLGRPTLADLEETVTA